MTTSTPTRTPIRTTAQPSARTPSARRTTADPAVRAAVFSSASDDWPTPQAFFDALHVEFGFVVDVCASASNRKAAAYYGMDHTDPQRRDGLAGDWAVDGRKFGGAAWLNPPYGRGIGAWMAKAAETAAAGVTVVALVPARTDTAWFHDHALAYGAEVRHVRGRLKFGTATNSAPFASLVLVFHARPVNDAEAGGESTDVAAARPQGDVQSLLETGQRDQVRPALSRQQRLHRGTRQTRVTADGGDAGRHQRSPKVKDHLPDVPSRRRRIRTELAVGEDAVEQLGRTSQPLTAAHHDSHATGAKTRDQGPDLGELQPAPCELSDQRGTLPASRTDVRASGTLLLPRQSAGKGGAIA